VPLLTVAVPVNCKTVPFDSPTRRRFIVAFAGTGFEAVPTRTPCPLFFEELGRPVPEIEPCPLLLFAIKQTVPCTENVPTGVVTLQGLETNATW
jgi:hypothetical protein